MSKQVLEKIDLFDFSSLNLLLPTKLHRKPINQFPCKTGLHLKQQLRKTFWNQLRKGFCLI